MLRKVIPIALSILLSTCSIGLPIEGIDLFGDVEPTCSLSSPNQLEEAQAAHVNNAALLNASLSNHIGEFIITYDENGRISKIEKSDGTNVDFSYKYNEAGEIAAVILESEGVSLEFREGKLIISGPENDAFFCLDEQEEATDTYGEFIVLNNYEYHLTPTEDKGTLKETKNDKEPTAVITTSVVIETNKIDLEDSSTLIEFAKVDFVRLKEVFKEYEEKYQALKKREVQYNDEAAIVPEENTEEVILIRNEEITQDVNTDNVINPREDRATINVDIDTHEAQINQEFIKTIYSLLPKGVSFKKEGVKIEATIRLLKEDNGCEDETE